MKKLLFLVAVIMILSTALAFASESKEGKAFPQNRLKSLFIQNRVD